MKKSLTTEKTFQAHDLFSELSQLIEQSRTEVAVYANSTLTLLFWQVGRRINEHILQNKRANYGKQIVVTLARQLSWSHILILLPIKSMEDKLYYAKSCAEQAWGKRELREQINRKAFKRSVVESETGNAL
jgi:hypothetical protein